MFMTMSMSVYASAYYGYACVCADVDVCLCTDFMFKRYRVNDSILFFTIHPVERPNYFLSVDEGNLVVKVGML